MLVSSSAGSIHDAAPSQRQRDIRPIRSELESDEGLLRVFPERGTIAPEIMRRQIGFGGGRHASTHNAAVGCGRPRDAGDGGCKDGRGQPGNAARTSSSWSCLHVLYPLLRLFLRYILPGLLILLVLSAVLTGV